MSDSVRPHGRQPTRLAYPWDSLGKNTAVGCNENLFLTTAMNPPLIKLSFMYTVLTFTKDILFCFALLFWPRLTACGILVLHPGFKPCLLAVREWSRNYWTVGQFPKGHFKLCVWIPIEVKIHVAFSAQIPQ